LFPRRWRTTHPLRLRNRKIRDWSKRECEPLPGKTMPALHVIERDYKNLHNQFIALGPLVAANGLGNVLGGDERREARSKRALLHFRALPI
jgi:nitrate reductase alpha subunit